MVDLWAFIVILLNKRFVKLLSDAELRKDIIQ